MITSNNRTRLSSLFLSERVYKVMDLGSFQSETRQMRELFRPNAGRDELNLAEFPITLLADRVPKGCKTLVFEDKVFDQQNGELVPRKVTITGSDAYGLPTAVDDEVLVALLQLTKLDSFKDPRVRFTRYEVLRILGWKDVGKNYQRIEEALNRWMGVTLYFEKAWWDNEIKAWVDQKFHILDNVQLLGKEERDRLRRRGQLDLLDSYFKWNEVVFKSFRADNLKRLDLNTYFNLKSSIAKRMFRFLDKRFYHRGRWEFDLEEFAFEHIGLSRSYDTGQVKAKLQPGLEELEARGFLEPLSRDDRYTRVGRGQWRVTLVHARTSPGSSPPAPDLAESSALSGLAAELHARGVTATTAAELARRHPAERIREKLEVFDWLVEKKDKRVSKSPSGFLVKSIQDDYSSPRGFMSKEDKVRQKREKAEEVRKAEGAKRREKEEERARDEADAARLTSYWESLAPSEKERVRAEALAKAPPYLLKLYRLHEKTNSEQAAYWWRHILSFYLENEQSPPEKKAR
jgi:hypothetical protein